MPKPTDPKTHAYMFSDDMKFLQKAVVFHPDDPKKFLVLKRADYHKYRPGDWDFPGGNVLYGEDAIESVLREIEEESGLKVKNLTPVQVKTKPQFEDNIYLLIINYTCVAVGTNVKLSKEHTEYKWVTRDEFKDMTEADFLVSLTTQIFETLE